MPLTLLLMAMIVFVTVAPVKSQGLPPTLDLTASPPCVCSTSAVYTFHVENPMTTAIVSITVTIPAGYTINPAYLTSTAGIIVATGVGGFISPHSTIYTMALKTTATSGTFEMFVDGSSEGFGIITILPTQTTPGLWVGLFTEIPANVWGEVTFVQGFFTNPCTVDAYSWSPNNALYGERVSVTLNPRTGYTNVVTITTCSPVGGVVAPTSKLEILAPYVGLAGLAVAVSAVVVVKKRKD
jgi:hypothetical protein